MYPLSIDVVSVQSQVVYGRVGNNVAVPSLTSLGLTVAAVPTVVFSNTPHYPSIHGGAIPIEWFEGYLQDLNARGATTQTRAVLMGYMGNAAQAAAVVRWVHQLRASQPQLHLVIDPVLGDHDTGLYVDSGLIDAYRQQLLPLADGLAPNGFELAELTGLPVHDINSVVTAARSLLKGRTQWVAVTSAAPSTWAPDEMQVVLVTADHTETITHPRIPIAPKGTGDLFCATLTGHWLRGATLADAARLACQQVISALQITQEAQCDELLLPSSPG